MCIICDGKDISGITMLQLQCDHLTELPDELSPELDCLICDDCPRLTRLPTCISYLTKLTWLKLYGCTSLIQIPDLPPSLTEFMCYRSHNLLLLPSLPPRLRRLCIGNLDKVREIPELPASLNKFMWKN
jgi:hypothetical protein